MGTPREIIRKVVEELRAADVPVSFVDGWETRGRPGPPAFDPQGVVVHHTATKSHSQDYPSLGIVRDGLEGLAGPLAHFGIGRHTGTVIVIAAGRANHAGPGGFKGLSGNETVWGIEAENDGRGETWGPEILRSYVILCAALARHTGFGADMVIAHREWSTAGKIDPAGIDMKEFRADVAQAIDNENKQETEETTMFIFDGPQGGVFRTDGVTRWPIRSMETAAVFMDVAKVRHLGKLNSEAFGDLRDGEATAGTLQAELQQLRSQLLSVEQKVDQVATQIAS
ncbi:MAG: peptidoglycan recognition protein family protein [Acidimicrobiales bacterium]